MREQRVVITGIGVVSPAGIGKEEFAESIFNGRNTIEEVNLFDTSFVKPQMLSKIKEFDFARYLKKEESDHLSDVSMKSVIAAKLAILDSQLKLNKENGKHVIDSVEPFDIGVSLGTGVGESIDIETMTETVVKKGWKFVPEPLLRRFHNNDIAKDVSDYFGIKGVNQVFSTACSAGNDAIVYAYNQIKHNKAKIMIAGGAESLSKTSIIGFLRMNAITHELCCPFDLNRKGTTPGEGAGIVILESYHHALQRKAHIYAEIAGYGVSCDAFHLTKPDGSDMGGPVKALIKAVKSANIRESDVDYICAHGTGTKANDLMETRAIKHVFKESARNIPISSIKSMIGHTGGASGALGAIACVLAMQKNMVPPTINYCTKDSECDLDYVPNKAREKEVKIAINNSFAFGGNNTCLVLKKDRSIDT
ncbi:MAG TPA: beta-ketoacyl-[acyl-carrier-protein] synthase II [Lachnospiraceae bacterium]|nr:beta-ketoacyl-[acyl-carrier-protein] synthase family protein [uncultured Lachnoclostridium sp.]HAU84827.1 beta-ketoacyl-[acyl-carrier-protein] synthase II [Lachnospiraceae bacterium]